MYAIIKTGSKQYRVKEGDTLHVELLNEQSGTVTFGEVLMFNDGSKSFVGALVVPHCTVVANIVGIVKGPKVRSMTYKKRCNQHRRIGHRQIMHKLIIESIEKKEEQHGT